MLCACVSTANAANVPDVVCIYVAARRIPALQNKDQIHLNNVILLDQHLIDRCYGPTLLNAHVMRLRTLPTVPGFQL